MTDKIKGFFSGQRGKDMMQRGRQQMPQAQQKLRQFADRVTRKR